nr:purine permease 3-like [Ipomoea batatas]
MEASEGKGSMRMSRRRLFLFLNGTMMCIGSCGGPLLVRLYFIRGGDRIWFSTWISTAGWPITFIPLAAAYYTRRRTTTTKTNFFTITRNITLAGAALGVLLGIINYLYTYGISKLPVSTSSLIVASQLAFTAGAAFVLVKQRFTAFTVNAVMLLTIGAGVLAVGSSGDRPAGESKKEYVAAFLMTFAAAALYGALLPSIELTYTKATQSLTYTLVLEFQMVMSLFATAVCTVGMLVNKDFQVFSGERERPLLLPKPFFLNEEEASTPSLIFTDSSFWSISFQSCPFSFRTSSLGRASPKGFDPLGFTVVSFPFTFPFCCPSAKGNVLGCKFNLGLEELPSSPFFPQESESVPLLRLLSLKLSNAPPSDLDFHPSSSFFLVQLSESPPPPPPFDSKLPLLSKNRLPSKERKAFSQAQLSESLISLFVSARRSESPDWSPSAYASRREQACRRKNRRNLKTAAKPGAPIRKWRTPVEKRSEASSLSLTNVVAAAAARKDFGNALLRFPSESKAQRRQGEEIGRP